MLKRVITVVVSGVLALTGVTTANAAGAPDDQDASRANAYYAAVAKAEAASGLTRSPKAEKPASPGFSTYAGGTVDASKFAVGKLMSDAVFYNGAALTAAQVQTFLNNTVPACRTGYTCLDDFRAPTADRPADDMCAGYSASGTQSAATIIATVGSSCGINPGVLVTLLQKEQGLVSDDWPSQTQYDYATGYACPDDPGVGCDPDTKGFFAQVYGAAWQFKRYANPGSTSDYFDWYPVHAVSRIPFSSTPALNCGTGPVAIWNKATAALYYYTPYQPDAAAIKDFFGDGDACSECGNRNFWGLYTQWFGDPNAGMVPALSRAGGADRYEVSVNSSKAAFPSGSGTVYIANGENFPDALSAAPAAAKDNAPVLLTRPGGLPAVVSTEIGRLGATKAVVVGGPASVSDAVVTALTDRHIAVTRFGGSDRYAVSRALVAAKWGSSAPTVYVATGANFPDALSAGAVAGSASAPVLLVNGSAGSLDAATRSLLATLHTTKVGIAGGPASVSPGIEQGISQLPGMSVVRYSGPDRFAVSVALNKTFGTAPSAYLANALNFPDALAGAAVAGKAHSPLYIVNPGCVPSATAAGVLGGTPSRLVLLGGPASVSDADGKLSVC